ncbi:MAG: hypothetical protein V7K86_23890 [Nostoc sp.]
MLLQNTALTQVARELEHPLLLDSSFDLLNRVYNLGDRNFLVGGRSPLLYPLLYIR